MRTRALPTAFYPVFKGLLLSSDGSVWSLIEEEREERVARLDPEQAGIDAGAEPLQIASYEVLLLSPN